MNLLRRVLNLWKGFLSLWIKDVESNNPEAVFESSIAKEQEKFKNVKEHIGKCIALRSRMQAEVIKFQKELPSLIHALEEAINADDDDKALVWMQRKQYLESEIHRINQDIADLSLQIEESKNVLLRLKTSIEQLNNEKVRLVTAKLTSQARIQIAESTEPGTNPALDNVRNNIEVLRAEAALDQEMGRFDYGSDLGKSAARESLNAYKRTMQKAKTI